MKATSTHILNLNKELEELRQKVSQSKCEDEEYEYEHKNKHKNKLEYEHEYEQEQKQIKQTHMENYFSNNSHQTRSFQPPVCSAYSSTQNFRNSPVDYIFS